MTFSGAEHHPPTTTKDTEAAPAAGSLAGWLLTRKKDFLYALITNRCVPNWILAAQLRVFSFITSSRRRRLPVFSQQPPPPPSSRLPGPTIEDEDVQLGSSLNSK